MRHPCRIVGNAYMRSLQEINLTLHIQVTFSLTH